VGPAAGLDDVQKKKLLTLPGLGTPTPWSALVVQPIASRYIDCTITALNFVLLGMEFKILLFVLHYM
jgi:hypothetical protein